jgi:heme/copper-type cytochrome/quinol oxidase subunit 1
MELAQGGQQVFGGNHQL